MQVGDIVEGKIDSLAFGGEGILKTDGLIVFVPFTAPGDRINCRIVTLKKNFATGEGIDILEKGPDRIEPRCPYYGVCGGCQLQHISYEGQVSYKQRAVIDALKRIGKISLPEVPVITPASPIWAYRRHITLSLAGRETGFEAGYIATDQYSIVPVTECSIFLDKGSSLFQDIQAIVHQFICDPANEARLTVLKIDAHTFALHFRFKRLPPNTKTVLEAALRSYPGLRGLSASDSSRTEHCGEQTFSQTVDELRISFSTDVFLQNHAEQSLNIYRDIVGLCAGKNEKILDLYCGIGISSLLLAKNGHKVFGVEGNPTAITLAKQNAEANQLQATFVASDVKKGLKKLLKEFKPQTVIVNPPRTGLDKEVLDQLQAAGPERIIYISCMPPTLARDIGPLCNQMYCINECKIYDMFPQTSHVETLVELIRQ